MLSSTFRIRELLIAYECGLILNPFNLRAKVEGARMESFEFENGRLTNGSFTNYPLPRFRDLPPLHIHLLDRPDLPSVGAGETPIIVVAPALAGALYDLTQQRHRFLPLRGA